MLFHTRQPAGGLEGHKTGATSALNLEVGRTLALVIISLAIIGAATILWLNKLDTPAAAVFAVGEAVLVGGFGIVVGERSGAVG